VKAIAPRPLDMELAGDRIPDQLKHCQQMGFAEKSFKLSDSQLEISDDYGKLKDCRIVLECVIEDIQVKASVYKKITEAVDENTIIASNTSAIAISTLQMLVSNPARFMGIHWAEPAYATRFMEITCGEQTCVEHAEWVFKVAHFWGKEPTLLRKDIRGFITNRLMYAVYREIFCLMEQGRISMEDADKAFRYDAGSWITFMGVFRRMDFTGLRDWATVLKNIIPTLSNSNDVPAIMQQMVEIDARGTQNLKGLYKYSIEEARDWEDAYALFNKDIFLLASHYPSTKTGTKQEYVTLI
jgi:3-hydroxybutyryl-CoA dehydrogenase